MKVETKIIYYKDEEKVPYVIKLNIAPDKVTLRDFKNALNINVKCLKFFFQTIVDGFGFAKEEIRDDHMTLPFVIDRTLCWIIQSEGSLADSDSKSQSSLIMNDNAEDNCQEIAKVSSPSKRKYDSLNVHSNDISLKKKRQSYSNTEEIIKSKNELIAELRIQIANLNTELLYRDGLLHCRGVIEKYENDNSTQIMRSLTRKQRWSMLLDRNNNLYQSIRNCIGKFPTEKISTFINDLYTDLSNKIHNPQIGPKSLKICGDITCEDAQLIACICNQLRINWESDLIDQNLKIIRERLISNRSFTIKKLKF